MKRRGFLKALSSIALGVALSTPLRSLCDRSKPEVKYDPVQCWTVQLGLDGSVHINADADLRDVAGDLAQHGLQLKFETVNLSNAWQRVSS